MLTCNTIQYIAVTFTTAHKCVRSMRMFWRPGERMGQSKTFWPVHMRFHMTVAAIYMTAVSLKTRLYEPVFSTIKPTAETPKMPAKEPKVLARPNSLPAYLGAMSDMLATNPA
jgi:hypothetical protein